MLDWYDFLIGTVAGVGVGAGGMWVVIALRTASDKVVHQVALSELRTKLELSEREAAESRGLFSAAREELSTLFSELSLNALQRNNELFLSLAEQALTSNLIKSEGELGKHREAVTAIGAQIREVLERVDGKIQIAEKERAQGQGDITRHLSILVESAERLSKETSKLSTALRSSKVQGSWGEAQLRNIVESLGLLPNCDFAEQVVTGDRQRPDLIVSLPYRRKVVIDAKAPISPLLEGEMVDAKQVADTIKSHIKALSARRYHEVVSGALDFTMMFLPTESLCTVALESDPEIYQFALQRNVLLVTPLSLVGFLTLVSSSWQSVRVDENAKEMLSLGRELYRRVTGFIDHFSKLGRSINATVKDYNTAIGSFDTRLMPSLKRFHEIAGEAHQESLEGPVPVHDEARH